MTQADRLYVSGKHIPALDGLRGLAVAAVFLLHYHPDEHLGPVPLRFLDQAANLGWAGVSLFFALSGFLITGILWDSLGKAHWWRNFYIRRSLRIFPLYYLVLIVVAMVAVGMGTNSRDLAKILIDFLYLSNIPWLWKQMFGFPLQSSLVHFWSLAVEEQFYLIWPFLVLSFAKRRSGLMLLCGAIWIASFAFRLVADGLGWSWLWSHHFLLSRAGELCAGALLALALRGSALAEERVLWLARWVFWVSLPILIVLGLVAPGLSLMDKPWSSLGVAVISLCFTALIAECLTPGVAQRIFSHPFLRWLGKISYGVYVYHLLLYGVFEWIAKRIAPNAEPLQAELLLLGIAIFGTLSIASLSFYTFERACLSLKDKWARTGSAATAVPSQTEADLVDVR